MKDITIKCKKGLELDKSGKVFHFSQIEKATITALSFLASSNSQQRVSNYLPNQGTVFCNKYPVEPNAAKSGSNNSSINILSSDNCKLISISELRLKSTLYDMLVIVRDENGSFAYHTKLITNILQVCADFQNKISHGVQLFEEIPNLPELICNRPISKIAIGESEEEVSFYYY